MLISLIKYEFKSTYKIFFILYALVLAFSFINRFTMGFDISGINYWSSYINIDARATALFIFGALYAFLLITTVIMTIFITIQRFYKNILGDTGYLMNTLPLRPWMNIFSKLFVSTFWILLGMFVCGISVVILFTAGLSISDILKGIFTIFSEINIDIFIWGIKFLISTIIGQAANVMIVYCSISTGHLFNSHKKLMAFITFLGIMIITNYVSSTLIFNPSFNFANFVTGHVISGSEWFCSVINASILFNIIYIAVTFIITNYILENKLNLE